MKKQQAAPSEHPRIIDTGLLDPAEEEPILRCPICRHMDTLEGFDVMGADPDCVFCISCNSELSCRYRKARRSSTHPTSG